MTNSEKNKAPTTHKPDDTDADQTASVSTEAVKEVGGRKGPEATRYGDWEKNGIISDF